VIDVGIDAEELIGVAARHGFTISQRSLELWRYRGLLPRGRRSAGTKATWIYPRHSEAQLLRLLHWRKRTRRLDLILIALWVDGFDIPTYRARDAMVRIIDSFFSELLGELDHTDDMSAALDRCAHKLASKRGRGSLPRVVRMSAAERTHAVAFMLAHLLDLDEEIARRAEDRVLLERMFGLRSGHAGGLAALLGLDEDPILIPRLPSPARLREILDSAPEEELEFVRRVAHMFVVWIPLLMPSFIDQHGAKATQFLEVMRALDTGPNPEFHAFAAITFLVVINTQTPSLDYFRQLQTFTSTAVNLELLANIPAERRAEAFKGLPLHDRTDVLTELQARRAKGAEVA
jgi:hypothetical protein